MNDREQKLKEIAKIFAEAKEKYCSDDQKRLEQDVFDFSISDEVRDFHIAAERERVRLAIKKHTFWSYKPAGAAVHLDALKAELERQRLGGKE